MRLAHRLAPELGSAEEPLLLGQPQCDAATKHAIRLDLGVPFWVGMPGGAEAGPGPAQPSGGALGCVVGAETEAWRSHHTALREPRARPRRRGGNPGGAILGNETFCVHVVEDAMRPRMGVDEYVWVDPDAPAAHGRLVVARDSGRFGETVVRLLIERDGRRILRAFDER